MAASKFTPENRSAIVARLEVGTSLAEACRAAGLREQTVKGWLTRGRREDAGDYAHFSAAIDRARECAEGPMVAAEFQRHLDRSVRAGSVQAMKLWWEIHPAREVDAEADAFEELDAFERLDDPLAEVDALARSRGGLNGK